MDERDAAAGPRIRDRLLSDHRELEDLLAKLLQAFEANDRAEVAELWGQFDARLLAHLEAEERHLIPTLLRVNPRTARAILEEHKHLRGRLLELGAGVDLHIVRLDAARAFIDELRAHATHEDEVLYEWADENVGKGTRTSMLSTLADSMKARLLARTGTVM